jgi:3-oxoacyl-[acyl-carrier protein] reductase
VNLGLEGRAALVVGATGGLGGAIAEELAREGARVGVAGRNGELAARLAERIVGEGGEAVAVHLDLAVLSSLEAAVGAVCDRFGGVDILVNNTGGPPPTLAAGNAAELWSDQFRAMVLGVVKLADEVLPAMRAHGWGRIITTTSSGVVAPIPNLALSNALRLSLVGWSKTLAREVAADGVTVNVVVPGRIATPRLRALDEARAKREGTTVDQVVSASTAAIPVGRYGDPEEYAAAVAFLASARASYITGTMLRVDGGLIPSI